MAKSHRGHIVGIFLVSCCALTLLIVSLATESWVVSDVVTIDSDLSSSHVNYGLFKGTYERYAFLSSTNYEIITTCVFGKNKCAMSCLSSAAKRRQEVEKLLAGETVSFLCRPSLVRSMDSSRQNEEVSDKNFLNAGLLVSTILFLVLTLFLGFISVILGLLNICSNPYNPVFSLPGIVIFNMVAIVVNIMTIILWGAQFGANIVHNVALIDTLVGEYTSNDMARLGYSYWLLFPTILCFGTNIGLVYHREYVLNKQPSAESIAVEQNTDGVIFLY